MNIKSIFQITFVILCDTTVNADEANNLGKSSRSTSKPANTTYVVNLELCSSCLSEEEKEVKETFEEVPTYAELKLDPLADLPSLFTICSSVMTTYGSKQMFFNLLGKDRNTCLGSFLQVDDQQTSFYHGGWVEVKSG